MYNTMFCFNNKTIYFINCSSHYNRFAWLQICLSKLNVYILYVLYIIMFFLGVYFILYSVNTFLVLDWKVIIRKWKIVPDFCIFFLWFYWSIKYSPIMHGKIGQTERIGENEAIPDQGFTERGEYEKMNLHWFLKILFLCRSLFPS